MLPRKWYKIKEKEKQLPYKASIHFLRIELAPISQLMETGATGPSGLHVATWGRSEVETNACVACGNVTTHLLATEGVHVGGSPSRSLTVQVQKPPLVEFLLPYGTDIVL